jgi:predicted kinase
MHDLSSNDAAPTLHLVCGKIGAGKSTLSQQLALKPRHVLISEDAWLAALYPGEIHSIADYLQRAAALRNVLADHLRALLQAGVSVVLDFPFNTPSRAWAREVFSPVGAAHQLHFLDIADEVCKARLRAQCARRASVPGQRRGVRTDHPPLRCTGRGRGFVVMRCTRQARRSTRRPVMLASRRQPRRRFRYDLSH